MRRTFASFGDHEGGFESALFRLARLCGCGVHGWKAVLRVDGRCFAGSASRQGVGIVAQVFEHIARHGRGVFVTSHERGQGPGRVAGEPSGSNSAPLEEQVSHRGVGMQFQNVSAR